MGGSKVNPEGGGDRIVKKTFINQILALKFLLQKTLGLTQEGG